jgi:MscS family membrane protein
MFNFRKTIVVFALCISACLPLSAQSALSQILAPASSTTANSTTKTDQLGRNTPYGTVYGFLQAAQSGNYTLAAQYLQLSASRRQTQGDDLAMKLYVAMNKAFSGNLRPSRDPEGTPQEDVPLDRQKLGTMSSGDVDVQLELVRISDPSAGKIWLFSADTLAGIPELYDQISARKVESKLPPWAVKHQLAGLPVWQWLALLLLIPVAAGVGWLLLILAQVPLRWWAKKQGEEDLAHWRSVSAPGWLLVGTIIHRILASYLGLPLLPRHYYFQVTAVAGIIGLTWILWRVVRWFLQRVRSRALARGHGGTGSLMLLGERIIKAVIFVMGLFLIFGILGFNLTTALAGVGIGTLAIGFGAQQTIANLFGGVSVLGDEVIHVGDVCKFGDRTGTVEDIGLRSTRVRTDERTLLVIPNGTIATINVENLSRRDKILFRTVLALHLETTPDHLRYVLTEIRNVITSHPKIEKNTARVRLLELTPSAINVEVVSYVLTQDFDVFAQTREELLLGVMHFVEDSGTTLASPSQTLYLSQDAAAHQDKIKTAGKIVEQNANQSQSDRNHADRNTADRNMMDGQPASTKVSQRQS